MCSGRDTRASFYRTLGVGPGTSSGEREPSHLGGIPFWGQFEFIAKKKRKRKRRRGGGGISAVGISVVVIVG